MHFYVVFRPTLHILHTLNKLLFVHLSFQFLDKTLSSIGSLQPKTFLTLKVEGMKISSFVPGDFSLPPNLLNTLEACLNLYFNANVRTQDHFRPCTKLPRNFRLLANE